MSDIQTLVDMGFPREKAERALQVTNNKGVEQAMEWLLAHADEDIPAADPVGSATGGAPEPAVPPAGAADADQAATEAASGGNEPESTDGTVAKSLKCDECGKLFKSQDEVEFHAAKTKHSSFSESTEEKKPLSEDEKRAQLALLEDKMRRKRQEREENEKKEAQERERLRIKSGKDMLEARRKMEEVEMKRIMDQRKREKLEEKRARDRVRAQIEADRAARKAKEAGGELPASPPPVVSAPVAAEVSTTTTAATAGSATPTTDQPAAEAKTYANAKIAIRMLDGSHLVQTFDAKEQLAAVRLFIQLKLGTNAAPFGLMTNFPKKIFTNDEYEVPLEKLGLCPNAVLIVTKAP